MALITRCPVCGTLFKVVPDQLRISEGWVRCGHCAEIFDASGDLQQSDAEHHSVYAADAVPEPAEPDVSAYLPEPTPEPIADPQDLAPELAVLAEIPVSPGSESAVWDAAPSPPPEAIPELDIPVDSEPELLLAEDIAGVDVAVNAEEDIPSPDEDVESEPPQVAADAGAYSFVRDEVPSTVASKPVVYWLGVCSVCVLMVLLGLQIVVHQRHRLAANWPESRSGLLALCQPLGCTIDPLQEIESIVIDSSTLSSLQNGEAYRLSLVLKNQARVDLAMPAIEFVLTDIDEQAVSKRMLSPVELGAASRVLFAGREWTTSVDLRVTDKAGKARVVGYRLLAFYP
nr:DUF3426 domain-containing protein [uncultured Albidiferax sp.]